MGCVLSVSIENRIGFRQRKKPEPTREHWYEMHRDSLRLHVHGMSKNRYFYCETQYRSLNVKSKDRHIREELTHEREAKAELKL